MMASDEASTLSTPADETAAGSPSTGSSPARNLIVVVVQHEDADTVTNALLGAGHRLTRINTAGGFFRRGNATLLIGLREGKEEAAVKALENSCRQRIEYLTLPLEGSPLPMPTPVPVTVGGATVFALPVEHFEEL